MKRSGPLARKAPPQASPALLTRSPLKPGRKPRASVSAQFRAAGGPRCALCGSRQALTTHHLIPQQVLRALVRSLRLPSPQARVLEHRLINDERGALTLCWLDHERFENRAVPIPRSKLPLGVFALARELDALVDGEPFTARLERLYPRP